MNYADSIVGFQVVERIHEILSQLAKKGKAPITYGQLASQLNDELDADLTPDGTRLRHALGEVSRCSHEREGCMLSVMVVLAGNSADGKAGAPGGGFFRYAKELGYAFEDVDAFFVAQITAVYAAFARR